MKSCGIIGFWFASPGPSGAGGAALPVPVCFLDIVGLLIIAMGALWGGGQGLLSTIVVLLAVLLSGLAARSFGDVVGGVLNNLAGVFNLSSYWPDAAQFVARMSALVGRGVVFCMVFLLLAILGRQLRRGLRRNPAFGWLDLAGGLLFGAFLGGLLFLVVARLLIGASWAAPLVEGSVFLPWVQRWWAWF